jgi:hypothetical protein
LAKHKKKTRVRGTSGTQAGPPLRKRVAVMTGQECTAQPPGFFQTDPVQHDGGNPSGEFCYTLAMTDVATDRTAHYPLKNKAHKWARDSLEDFRGNSPFLFHPIHSDSGGGFLSHAVLR